MVRGLTGGNGPRTRAAASRAALGAALAGVAALALVPQTGDAANSTLYVDRASIGGQCSDARSATEAANPATPWCTLPKAFAAAPAASTVVVRAGIYPRVIVKHFHRTEHVVVAQAGEQPLLSDVIIDRSDHLEFRGLRINRAYATYSSNLRFVANEVTVGGFWARNSDHLTYEGK